jgi:hypothetical protein
MQQHAGMTKNTQCERFIIKARITMVVNRYEIRSVDTLGRCPVIAMAQQKRTASGAGDVLRR